ncbi:hypothetical protein LSTR_LSTR002626 [Laodelphax striatellus]|uniref:Bee-milk protein n=1 Tax=Laodelphax striatellus TaxID=195883 RepID=A0A482XLR0_LAOST|nr:hypothetical protein LSTR_LSTR002626 [Laodelphax striatellus]
MESYIILSLVLLAVGDVSQVYSQIEDRAAKKLKLYYESEVPLYTDNPNIPSTDSRQTTIPINIAMIDADYWWDEKTKTEKVFVTTPRQKPGTPASLSTIVYSQENKMQLLAPYPSWKEHDIRAGCDSIISVFRTQVDECGRLWVIDTGIVDSATAQSRKLCQPKILIYDLKTDKLIGKYEVPNDLLVDQISLLITIVVDNRDGDCKNSYAYVADTTGFQIIVFESATGKFWQFKNKYMFPFPEDGTFQIAGVNFDFMDGILGMAIGPLYQGDRTVFFHSLAGRKESYVQTSVLRNSSLSGDLDSAKQFFYLSSGARPSQSAAEAMTRHGALIFGLLSENALACWNKNTPFRTQNFKKLEKDDVRLQFLSGVKIVNDVLILVSSRLQNYFIDAVNDEEINYRVFLASVDQITKGTKCHKYS